MWQYCLLAAATIAQLGCATPQHQLPAGAPKSRMSVLAENLAVTNVRFPERPEDFRNFSRIELLNEKNRSYYLRFIMSRNETWIPESQRCIDLFKPKYPLEFEILMNVRPDGGVRRLMGGNQDQSEYSKCLMTAIMRHVFPPHTGDAYFHSIIVNSHEIFNRRPVVPDLAGRWKHQENNKFVSVDSNGFFFSCVKTKSYKIPMIGVGYASDDGAIDLSAVYVRVNDAILNAKDHLNADFISTIEYTLSENRKELTLRFESGEDRYVKTSEAIPSECFDMW